MLPGEFHLMARKCNPGRRTLLIKYLRATPMIEYAILIVMVIFAAGFAWLWLIEQKKRKEARRQKEIERR
jgi:hypothetical protein